MMSPGLFTVRRIQIPVKPSEIPKRSESRMEFRIPNGFMAAREIWIGNNGELFLGIDESKFSQQVWKYGF